MKVSSSLVVCVGCIIILQTKSLENLAEIQEFTEIPTQSSSYVHNLFDATNAIDGKFEGEEGDATACSFTIGGEQNTRAWWKLPLTQLCHVEYLLIYFRSTSCCIKEVQDVCRPCDPKCFNNLCDSHNGSCIYGCSNAYKKAPNCTNCIIGYYGNDCHHRCGHCKNGTHCDSTSGKCPEGCEEHWNGSLCDSCKSGYYGSSCSMKCSHCKMGTNCNNTTGICEAGCEEHWREPKCNVCQDGYYGEECKFSCGKCKSEAFCDNTTGDCHNGCQENWLGSRCDICLEGFYSKYCDLACSKCKVGTLCNNITGECPEGCEFNWQGPKCDICKKGFCGSNCTQLCDRCRNESICNNITGDCSQGCKDHWNGSREDGFYSMIANAILAFLLAVAIALIVFQRRRISALQYDRQMMDQHNIYQGGNRSHNYDNMGVLEETHEYTCLDSARELHFQDSSVL
uniref:Protein draper-like n=1 Tax=Crassostrea virginica TaxID=6565 RepID=A0A8B8C9V7_CRAVI|nr:protein draper-like [Crassostrea virginica]